MVGVATEGRLEIRKDGLGKLKATNLSRFLFAILRVLHLLIRAPALSHRSIQPGLLRHIKDSSENKSLDLKIKDAILPKTVILLGYEN